MKTHVDLFSGIGGFAYAADQVWGGLEHIFCDIEPFSQQIIGTHWPESKIYGDIRDIKDKIKADILTGGFPCQPFSSSGKRRGSEDDRHLWPEMLRVIRLTEPEWVVAENVRGLITWNNGMVLEQACIDLENIGYAVQPIVIPAIALDSVHRRDRVWIIAHNESKRRQKGSVLAREHTESEQTAQREWADLWVRRIGGNSFEFREEDESFICGMDDGLPDRVDRLKGLGNAIVPQIAIEIFKAIKSSY